MGEQGVRASELQDDLRATDSREWQLWFLTLGLLLIFALGSIAAAYFLLQTSFSNGGLRQVALRLLAGLAVLIALFCLYVFQARLSVSRFKLFLNEMSGMATGNLRFQDCLDSIVQGMARTCRAPFSRFLILREADGAVEVASTTSAPGASPRPDRGYSHALEDLPLLSAAIESLRPEVMGAETLAGQPEGSPERLLLTGGLAGLRTVLVLPVRGRQGLLGLQILGRHSGRWGRAFGPAEIARGHVLAGHAGRVIEEAIRRRDAVRDPLTGLYNRRHFSERMHQELQRASRTGRALALLLCDLDRFKQVNDTLGHQVGDEVLRFAATATRSATRGTDLHFRWGGDELVVVLSGTTSSGVLKAAERIRDQVRLFSRERQLDIDMSIGIALYPDHGRDEEELLRVADLAMYVAKKSGDKVRVGFETYHVDENSVIFAYQPIRDARSGEIHGHEIFTRDPGGRLSPLELFEKYRAVGQLDSLKRLIFEQQLCQAAAVGVRRLFVNAEMDFLRATTPLPRPDDLEVIIEVADPLSGRGRDEWLAGLSRWRREGYRLALAGFGTDLSALPLLESIRPDYLKVSRSSMVQAVDSSRHRAFLQHLLLAAASLTSSAVIAEGIETRLELQAARDLGIGLAQGFLLGRPARHVEDHGEMSGTGLADAR